MYDVLFKYIEDRTGEKLTDIELDAIMAAFERKRMRKRQFFLREGDVCKYMGFIVKGSARIFTVDEKGHEHITRFIEMLEDSELLMITLPNATELRNKSRCVDLMIKVLDQFQAIAMQKRIHAVIGMTAEERYCDLSRTYPQFLERFPMNMIASYLGLSPETLSRIRKNAIRK
jgi:CRP-like cAMP-binding protein